MQYSDVLTEVAERLQAALKVAAQQLHSGRPVECSLALLSSVALEEMSLRWGTIDVLDDHEGHFELVVGLDDKMLTASFVGLLRRMQEPHEPHTDGEKSAPPIIGPLVKRLSQEDVVPVLLLLVPAHTGLWSERRRWLKTTVVAHDVMEGKGENFLPLLLLQELLLTSLLVSCHHKVQEVWVHRWWVEQQMLKLGGMDLEAFHIHDRSVLFNAADKHPMNYSAWNHRRQVFAFQFQQKGAKESVKRAFLLQELDAVVHFFEKHNGDTSAVAYLTFLLEQATAKRGADFDKHNSVALHVWGRLLAVTTQELRRHYDKGHEAVWMLRLALMRWALCEHPRCGWTLQDELDFVSTYASVVTMSGEDEDEGNMELDVTWVDVSGAYWWTSYHAVRYGLQLLRMLRI
ncbi:hypothetical protein TCSYLVIO_001313 [Trypanosoma cruzi]|nr:hypothetical protein TCSYLVIO_001313 [Trypanosoma cruzi]